MLEVSEVIGPFGWYHGLVAALTVVRAFPCAWLIFMGPFVVPPVRHWCAKPPLPVLANWTEVEWLEAAIPPADGASTNAPSPQAYDACRMHPLQRVHPNGSVEFDKDRVVPCESWTYDVQVSRASSAVPEVSNLFV
ncbi:hypothetical protein HPB48_002507 [Haemaphysalis longicornis]|uniref:Uncharacterized protein n=1 Tax=Haemaphysalis longicornis TaxID=44386 RepID=A0A9J6G4Y7_HAELO|nr:hypothetical protein HPB48_002507 [Haemaphysalis longicornis]